jgi:hypothetical protein
MLMRLQELGPTISAVIGAGLVNKEDLTPHQQKAVLKEAEEILKPMAAAQRIWKGTSTQLFLLCPAICARCRRLCQILLPTM